MIGMTNKKKHTTLHEAYSKIPHCMAAEYEHSSHMVVAILKRCTSVSHIYIKAPMERQALHAATMHIDLCKFNHTLSNDRVVQQLFEGKKSMIKGIDQCWWTPIHYAAYHRNYLILKLILKIDRTAAKIADKDRKMTAVHLVHGPKRCQNNMLASSLMDEGDAKRNTTVHFYAVVH
ncbi:hypothetical protein CUMW_165110 [Citrus unshiu]|nr:hypothetical protein CUMW_165110 [Citrus unshiu]